MSCYCSCAYGEETGTFYQESFRKARKKHRCCECKKDILPGEKYQLIVGVDEGKFYHFKTCSACVEIRTALCDDCYNIGNLFEDIEELTIAEFDTLSPTARDKISEVWG